MGTKMNLHLAGFVKVSCYINNIYPVMDLDMQLRCF